MKFTLLVLVSSVAMFAADLSKYRGFQFGMSLSSAVKHSGMDPSESRIVHKSPARIDELVWNPARFAGMGGTPDPVREVVFSFYNGHLYRMAIEYENEKTEGLNVQDMVDAMSVQFGTAVRPTVDTFLPSSSFAGGVKVVAIWDDNEYVFKLVQPPYGLRFGVIAVSKRLDDLAQRSIEAGAKLDEQQAPQRLQTDEREAQSKLAKERALNRQNFHP